MINSKKKFSSNVEQPIDCLILSPLLGLRRLLRGSGEDQMGEGDHVDADPFVTMVDVA